MRMRMLALGIFLGLTVVSCGRFGRDQILTKTLNAKPPASVAVLDSSDNGKLDIGLFSHFKIVPADLKAVLNGSLFGNNYRPGQSSKDYVNFHPPAWWKPESLGFDSESYTSVRASGTNKGDTDTSIIITNRAHDEVFALFYTNY